MSAAAKPQRLPPLGWVQPPSIDEVRLEDNHTVETPRHFEARVLLKAILQRYLAACRVLRPDGTRGFWIGCDAPFYFSTIQARDTDFRAPDLMVFLDVAPGERRAWLVWDESGKRPDVIIELISESTADVDRTTKKRLYGPLLGVTNYILFDPFSEELEVLEWDAAAGWIPAAVGPNGTVPVKALGIEVGLWEGTIGGISAKWLRWFTPAGVLLPSPEEAAEDESQRAEAESQRAEAESQRAEAESQRAEALARRLAEYEARFGRVDPV